MTLKYRGLSHDLKQHNCRRYRHSPHNISRFCFMQLYQGLMAFFYFCSTHHLWLYWDYPLTRWISMQSIKTLNYSFTRSTLLYCARGTFTFLSAAFRSFWAFFGFCVPRARLWRLRIRGRATLCFVRMLSTIRRPFVFIVVVGWQDGPELGSRRAATLKAFAVIGTLQSLANWSSITTFSFDIRVISTTFIFTAWSHALQKLRMHLALCSLSCTH